MKIKLIEFDIEPNFEFLVWLVILNWQPDN